MGPVVVVLSVVRTDARAYESLMLIVQAVVSVGASVMVVRVSGSVSDVRLTVWFGNVVRGDRAWA